MVVILTGPEAGPTTALGTATIRNDSQFNRQGMVEFVHPVAQGVIGLGDPITVTDDGNDVRADWEPYGDRYPDGSIKRVRISYRTQMPATTSRTVDVAKSAAGAVPGSFTYPAHFLSDFELRLFNNTESASGALVFSAQNPHSVRQGVGGNSEVWTWYGRLPGTPMWAEFEIEPIHGMQHAPFTLWVGHHDIQQSRNEFTPTGNGIVFRMRRGEPLVRWDTQKIERWIAGPRYQASYSPSNFASGFVGVLVDGGFKLGHGQSTCIKGTVQFSDPDPAQGSLLLRTILAENDVPMLAVSDEWVNFPESYMPCRQIGKRPSYVPSGQTLGAVTSSQRSYIPFDSHALFEGRLGLRPNPGGTGDMNDFGNSKLFAYVRESDPTILHSLQRDVYQEAGRPIHFREANPSSPFRLANHPLFVGWHQQPLCNSPVDPSAQSRDQLGRVPCYVADLNSRPVSASYWNGRDRQHYTCNFLTAYAMLSGDRWATRLCDAFCEQWLAEWIDPDSQLSFFLRAPDEPRGIGRGLRAGAQLYYVTGRQDIKDRLSRRLDGIPQYLAQWIDGRTPVSTFSVKSPYPGNITVDQWYAAWEDGIAIAGIWQAAELTGHTAILPYVKRVARSQVMNGPWLEVQPGYWLIAKAIAWNNGQILTQQQLAQRGDPSDPNTTTPDGYNPQSRWNGSWGTAYNWWACAAPILGRMWAIEDQDSAWQARCEDIIRSLQAEYAGTDVGRWPNMEEPGMMYQDFAAIGPVDALRLSL